MMFYLKLMFLFFYIYYVQAARKYKINMETYMIHDESMNKQWLYPSISQFSDEFASPVLDDDDDDDDSEEEYSSNVYSSTTDNINGDDELQSQQLTMWRNDPLITDTKKTKPKQDKKKKPPRPKVLQKVLSKALKDIYSKVVLEVAKLENKS